MIFMISEKRSVEIDKRYAIEVRERDNLFYVVAVRRYILEQEGKSVFEYDIYECPPELKGQLTIGDFANG